MLQQPVTALKLGDPDDGDYGRQQRGLMIAATANTSPESRLPYFRGKGQVEETLKGSGLSCAIIRLTLVFGEGDLLNNNMPWAVRRFPLFPVFGRGDYLVQPFFAEHLSVLWVVVGCRNVTIASARQPSYGTVL